MATKRGLGEGSPVRAALSAPASAHRVISIRVPEDLYERFLNTVDSLAGPPERLSYVVLARRALEREIERLEKKHHSGRPFPSRPSKR